MRNIFISAFLLFGLIVNAQLNIGLKGANYVDPRTEGVHTTVTLSYEGEVHDIVNKSFTFIFAIKNGSGQVFGRDSWTLQGDTEVGNTIKDEGLLERTADQVQESFVDFLQGGGVLTNEASYTVIRMPELGYDDLANYFVMNGKLDRIQLPVSANAQALVKWLIGKTLTVNGEPFDTQFQFN